MAARRLRPTPRGYALTGVGSLAMVTGGLIGAQIVVQVGALLVLAVAAGIAQLTLETAAERRGRLRLVRRVTPHPVTAGDRAVVAVEVTSPGAARRLDRLQIAERAARELSGAAPLRARVQRAADRLTLTYPITPGRRGRWAVGPLEVHRRDVFGVMRQRGPLGDPMLVAVRPRVAPLTMTHGATSHDVERAVPGSRTPSADDSSLREYRTGDDLRRVHWPSSARRGELVVRQDERSGRRPASVVLDLPVDDAAAEWSISAAASIALALLHAGHHVRILGGDVLGSGPDHHRPDTGDVAAAALLDQTVDLTRPQHAAEQEAWLLTAIDTLVAEAGGAELVFAVVGELGPSALAALARVGDSGHGWAMVLTGDHGDGQAAGPSGRTLEGLRHAGWTACPVRPDEDLTVCWARLLGSDERLAVTR